MGDTVIKKGFSHEDRGNQNIEWYTPKWIFDRLNLQFDLDPCAPKGGVPWIPATRSYSIEDNGLIKEWKGRVFLNPPYGKFTTSWLQLMHKHRNGIALVFARTDCKWFHEFCAKADTILFLKGRIKFIDASGISKGQGAGSGSMLIAWNGPDYKNSYALENMKDLGLVVKL